MSQETDGIRTRPSLIWALALVVAGLGTWVLFDARPGINWLLWTGAAVAGLSAIALRRNAQPKSLVLLGGAPVVIAGAAGLTANQEVLPLIFLAIVFLLALQMLLVGGNGLRWFTLLRAPFIPLVAFWTAVVQSFRRTIEATNLIRSTRTREWVRGLAITLPVLVLFGLLLAEADPLFASWRDAAGSLFANWDYLPRAIFFLLLLTVVLGAYGHSAGDSEQIVPGETGAPHQWLGATERLLLLGSIAGLFWLFLVLQVGYLFGNLPQLSGSTVTFAEYARRGFGELSAVASLSVLLIVVSERYGRNDGRERLLRSFTFAVIAAVLLLLGSAFRRVLLYEDAYGFTTARLYAQVYMCAVAAGLVLLSREVARGFDAARLFRRGFATATILFIGLIYWNHEAWIANRNIDRFAGTGQLDIGYLANQLSPDAIPTIGRRLSSLPDSTRLELRIAVVQRYHKRENDPARPWFEWNLSRVRAGQAISELF